MSSEVTKGDKNILDAALAIWITKQTVISFLDMQICIVYLDQNISETHLSSTQIVCRFSSFNWFVIRER